MSALYIHVLSVATSIRVIIIEVNYGGTRWLIIEFMESVGDCHVECGMQVGGLTAHLSRLDLDHSTQEPKG